MGTANLGSLWAIFLLPLVFGVPTQEPTFGESVASHLPKGCQRCCDPEDPMSSADMVRASVSPYVLPEVRPYINITILKGEFPHGARRGQNWEGQKKAGQAFPRPCLPLVCVCIALRVCKGLRNRCTKTRFLKLIEQEGGKGPGIQKCGQRVLG